MNPTGLPYLQGPYPVEPSDYLRVLRRHAALILLIALLGAGAGAAYASRQTTTYESHSSVLVSVQSAGTVGDASTGATYAQQIVKTYADVATKPFVLNRVIESLGLRTTPAALAEDVTVTAATDATLITVSVRATSPDRAAAIANGVSQQLGRTVDAVTPTTTGQSSLVKMTVVEGARPDPVPVSPNWALIVAVGFIAGAALTIAVVVLRAAFDTRVRRTEDAQAAVDRPVLGRITRSSAVRKHPLIVRHDPHGRVAESFRTLRTNLQYLDVDASSQSIVVSSPSAGEGKTTTAVNLALTIADAGARVVVVDADLRRSQLGAALELETAVGLTDVLVGRVTLDDALQGWGDGALMVLPAGATPPNPSELLQGPAMANLLHALEGRFDVVLIDAPPLLPVSDAVILGTRTAGTILVCAVGATARGQLREAADKVEQVGGRVLGLVLTKVPAVGSAAATYARDRVDVKQPRKKAARAPRALKARSAR